MNYYYHCCWYLLVGLCLPPSLSDVSCSPLFSLPRLFQVVCAVMWQRAEHLLLFNLLYFLSVYVCLFWTYICCCVLNPLLCREPCFMACISKTCKLWCISFVTVVNVAYFYICEPLYFCIILLLLLLPLCIIVFLYLLAVLNIIDSRLLVSLVVSRGLSGMIFLLGIAAAVVMPLGP